MGFFRPSRQRAVFSHGPVFFVLGNEAGTPQCVSSRSRRLVERQFIQAPNQAMQPTRESFDSFIPIQSAFGLAVYVALLPAGSIRSG